MDLLLSKGDRVTCKTGGPVLFVEAVYSNRRLTCSWMDEMGQRHEAPFVLDSLDKLAPFSFSEARDAGSAVDEDDGAPSSGGEIIAPFVAAALNAHGAVAAATRSIVSAVLVLTRSRAGATAQ